MFKHRQGDSGFTILEVIIALVIVGVSITAFVRLLGNSSMLRAKVNDYDERLNVAILKTEQTFLGLLDEGFAQDDKKVLQGKVEGKDINWRIEDIKDDSREKDEIDARFYTVSVDGIEISSVDIR